MRAKLKLGNLFWPFIAASGMLIVLSVGISMSLADYFNVMEHLIGGLIIGAGLVVVLYAIIRAIAEHGRSSGE